MKNNNLPIVIGHMKDGKSDKCIVAVKEEGYAKIAICRLKDEIEKNFGNDIQVSDIEGIIKEMWICRKESLKVFIDTLQTMYDKWED